MGRDRDDGPVRVDAELDARRGLVVAVEELLDDPPHPLEPGEVVGVRLPRHGVLEPLHRLPHGIAVDPVGVAEEGVALPREAVVELDDGLAQTRAASVKLEERLLDVAERAEVLEALRKGHPCLPEDLPAARLRPEVAEGGVDAVQRDAEEDSQLPLERCGVEDGEVGPRRVPDPGADPLDQPGPLEDLLREGARRVVVGAEERQARAGVARRDPDEELEVVLEDQGVDGLRGHEDDPRPGVPKADQEEQEPLLVEARALQLLQLALVERQRRDDDRRVGLLVPHGDGVPDFLQPGLELLELGKLTLGRQVRRER